MEDLREVEFAEAEALCQYIPEIRLCMETSAKDNRNITEAFMSLATELKVRRGRMSSWRVTIKMASLSIAATAGQLKCGRGVGSGDNVGPRGGPGELCSIQLQFTVIHKPASPTEIQFNYRHRTHTHRTDPTGDINATKYGAFALLYILRQNTITSIWSADYYLFICISRL